MSNELDELAEVESTAENTQEPKSSISADLIRGHINTIILRTLAERDKYGYEIMNEISIKSHGQYELKQPTLYSALKRLETQQYITAYWKTDEVTLGGRRKYFTLTELGRKITEQNQAEWEYSRTVIDSLISDRSFDFNSPPPQPVDFKLLKQSTTRVPYIHTVSLTENTNEQENNEPIIDDTAIYMHSPAYQAASSNYIVKDESSTSIEIQDNIPDEQANLLKQDSIKNEHDELMRQRAHNNYLQIINSAQEKVQAEKQKEEAKHPLYANKPETEKDYKNLIDNLYVRTLQTHDSVPQQIYQPVTEPTLQSKKTDFEEKATADGLRINVANLSVAKSSKSSFKRNKALLISGIISGLYAIILATICFVAKQKLDISSIYPSIILIISGVILLGTCANLIIKGNCDYRKPTSHAYLSTAIICTILCILAICIVAMLLSVNFSSIPDIMRKMIIPCLVALVIPIFATSYYIQSKY